MKILHIITALSVGGAQSILHQLLRIWSSSPDQHRVISLVAGGRNVEDIRALGIEVCELGMQPGKLRGTDLLELSRAIRDREPELVQTWLYHADLIGGSIARLSSRAPIVWGIHHSLSSTRTLRPSTLIVARANALLSRVIPARIHCCSTTALESHARLGYQRSKMVIIPNGVDLTRFQPDPSARSGLRADLHLSQNARLIGMFARFHPQKDHQTMIAAAGLLHDRLPDVHFVLAGHDVDKHNAQLGEWISRAGIGDHVHLLGLREDMPRLHAAVDVFTLSSSEGEALPLVLCEAMACEVPCVATDVGDMRDVIGDTGGCVAPRDPGALAGAWIAVLELPPSEYQLLGKRARQRVQNKYDLEKIAGLYRDLYRRVLA